MRLQAQPLGLCGEVPAFRCTGGQPGRLCVGLRRLGRLAGQLQQVRPGGEQPVVLRHPLVLLERVQQVEACPRAVHQAGRDGPVERGERARRGEFRQVIEISIRYFISVSLRAGSRGRCHPSVGATPRSSTRPARRLSRRSQSLPLYPYLTTQTTKLTPHPSDPVAPGSRQGPLQG